MAKRIETMPKLPQALRHALKHNKYSQAAFSRHSGLAIDSIRHIIAGRATRSSTINIILNNLPEQDRAPILKAWLTDCIPKGHAGHINIKTDLERAPDFNDVLSNTPRGLFLREDIRSQLDHRTQRAFLTLIFDAIRNKSTRTAIRNISERMTNL